jgi:hypothetical protein
MASVHPMELSPLPRRQRAKDRVIEHASALTELALASCDRMVHGYNFLSDQLYHFFCGHASRSRPLRGFSSFGHVSQAHYDCGSQPVLQSRSARQRLPFLQAALTSFHRSPVGQIKVLQHFSRAPLSLRMACKLFAAHAACGIPNCILQPSQMTIQALIPQGTCFTIWKASANSL